MSKSEFEPTFSAEVDITPSQVVALSKLGPNLKSAFEESLVDCFFRREYLPWKEEETSECGTGTDQRRLRITKLYSALLNFTKPKSGPLKRMIDTIARPTGHRTGADKCKTTGRVKEQDFSVEFSMPADDNRVLPSRTFVEYFFRYECRGIAMLIMQIVYDLSEHLCRAKHENVDLNIGHVEGGISDYAYGTSDGKRKIREGAAEKLCSAFYDKENLDRYLDPGERVDLAPFTFQLRIAVGEQLAFDINLAISTKGKLCRYPEDLVVRSDMSASSTSEGCVKSILACQNRQAGKDLLKKCRSTTIDKDLWKKNMIELRENNREISFYGTIVKFCDLQTSYLKALIQKPAYLNKDGSYSTQAPGIYVWSEFQKQNSNQDESTRDDVREWGIDNDVWIEMDVSVISAQICMDPGWRAQLEATMYRVPRKAKLSHGYENLGMTSTAEAIINAHNSDEPGFPRALVLRAEFWEGRKRDQWRSKMMNYITLAVSQMDIKFDPEVNLDLTAMGNCSGLAWKLDKYDHSALVDKALLTQLVLREKHKLQDWYAVRKEYVRRGWDCSELDLRAPSPSSSNNLKRWFELTTQSRKYFLELEEDGPFQHLTWHICTPETSENIFRCTGHCANSARHACNYKYKLL